MRFIPPKLYPITDAKISGLSHLEQVKRFVEGGATLVQLREKNLGPGEWFDDAKACARFCREHGVTLIVNDRVDLAMAIGADGVHLGQEDMPVSAARKLLGGGAVIGLSTHTLDQVRRAVSEPIDYIGFGPIFPTTTKTNPNTVVGLEDLTEARNIAGTLPIVAIGGITIENAQAALDAGAEGVAIIGDLLTEPTELSNRMRLLIQLVTN